MKPETGDNAMKKYTTSWTGRKIKQDRLYGPFEVLHSSASGWYVFNHETVRVAAEFMRTIEEATKEAKRLNRELVKASKPTNSEKQGNGKRYWFNSKEAAREFAEYKKSKGWVVLDDEESWDDPDCGPSVWVSRSKKETKETQAYRYGVDTASGLFD